MAGSAKQSREYRKRNPLYPTWSNMVQRCTNPKDPNYSNYGGRGITVAAEWLGPGGYACWLAYVGPRPVGMTQDRIDNARGYEPGNVRWAPNDVQSVNKRITRRLTHNGETRTLKEWAALTGQSYMQLYQRVHCYGWTTQQALEEK